MERPLDCLIYKFQCTLKLNLIITLTLTLSLLVRTSVPDKELPSFCRGPCQLNTTSLFSVSVSVSTINRLPSPVRVWGDSGLAVRINPSDVGHLALLPSCHHTGGSQAEVWTNLPCPFSFDTSLFYFWLHLLYLIATHSRPVHCTECH